MPFHLSVVGRKNSGKTRLVSLLAAELTRRGLRVATVKTTSHDHEFDVPGTDSWQHRQAGSLAAIILSPGRWVCHTERPDGPALEALHGTLFRDKDLVLWEGRGHESAPRIECVPVGEESLFRGDPLLAAVVSESADSLAPRWFTPSAISDLTDWIIGNLAVSPARD